MAQKIQTGIEIKAGVSGTEAIKQLAATIGEVGVDTSQLREESSALAQAWEDIENRHALINQYKALKVGLKEVNTELTHTRQQMTQLKSQMTDGGTKEQEKKYADLSAKLAELTDKKRVLGGELRHHSGLMQQAGLSVKQLANHEKQLADEVTTTKAKLTALNGEAQRLKQLADARVTLGLDVDDRVRQELRKTEAAYRTLRTSGLLSKQDLARATEQYRQRMQALNAELRHAPANLNPIAGSLKGLGAAGLAVAGVGGGLYAVQEGIQNILDKTRTFQAVRSRLDYAFGGAEEGGRQLDFVREVANRLGLELLGAANGYAQLAAATKELNISQAQTRQIFSGVASAVAAMGLSADEANGVFLALSQIAGKGKVSMEELRGQLGERLAPAMSIAAKAMGVTTAELESMVEAGISAEVFLPKFGLALEQAFAADAAKNAETLTGQINLLKNQFNELLNGFGEGGVADAAVAVLRDIGQMLEWLDGQINGIDATVSGGLRDALVGMYEALKEIAVVLYETFQSNLDVINSLGAAITGLGADGERDFSIIKSAVDGLNISIGAVRDGIEAIGIGADVAAGIALNAFAVLARQASLITFGEVSDNYKRMAEEMEQDALRHFGRAHQAALEFESKTAAAINRAAETEAQRYQRLETEARQAYQQSAQAAIEAADAAQTAQQQAHAAIGTAAEAAAAKQAQAAAQAAGQAQAAAQRAEREWLQAFERIGGHSEVASQITQPLRDAGLAATQTAQEVQQVSRTLADAKGAASGLGLDLRAAMADPTLAMQSMLDNLGKLRQGYADLSATGIQAGSLLREALSSMLKSAANAADIEALKTQFRQLGEDGRLSMREVEQGILDADLRLQELRGSIDPTAAAFKRLGIQSQESLRLAAEQMRLAFDTAAASGQASAESLRDAFKRAADAALASGDRQQQKWVEARAAAYGYQVVLDAAGKAALKLAGEVAQSSQQQIDAHRQAADAARQSAQAARTAAAAQSAAAEEQTETAEAQATAVRAVAQENRRLASVSLAPLGRNIDDVRARMQSLRQEAVQTRQSLESELADVRGDAETVERLAYEQKLATLQNKLRQAEREGNREAAQEYQAALQLQQQIQREKSARRAEQSKQDRVAAEAAEAEALQKELAEQNAALQSTVPEIRLESAPVAVNIDDAMVQQLTGSLQNALSDRERQLVDKVITEVVARLRDEIKRMGK